MKAWGWISMRRFLEDAMNNAFEETTIKNVPMDQFWSFKWRNRVQNWNLSETLSKIGLVRNFDFWSKVNTKVKVNWSMVKVNGYWSGSVSGFRVGSRVEQQSWWCHPMTCRWRGLRLMWRCLHGCWCGVMTSSGDVRWHQ